MLGIARGDQVLVGGYPLVEQLLDPPDDAGDVRPLGVRGDRVREELGDRSQRG